MTLQHCLKVIAFGLLGFAFGPYLFIIAAMIVSGFIGTLIGKTGVDPARGALFQTGVKHDFIAAGAASGVERNHRAAGRLRQSHRIG